MAPRKRTRVLQNTTKQVPASTPVLQNNTKDRPVLVDKTNQIVTVKALRNRKVYHDRNTDTFVKVSKTLFKNGVIQSPRATSKRQTSTKKLTVPRKSSECVVVLERVVETNDYKDVVCKDKSSSSTEKQTLSKKLGKFVRKGGKCPVVLEKVGDGEVNRDITPPNVDKQTTTKRLGNIPQKGSKCSVALERNVEAKDQKKLVYEDVSPASAEKQKAVTPEKKIMLYDFRGGSGSSGSSSRKPARKRKPVRKRMKPPGDTSDEENCDVQSVTKKMKMLAAHSQEKQKDCTNLHSQSLQPSMNSVQPLRDQNIFCNQSVKSETRKFFKTPMRKQLVEMSLFNYTNQKKNKFSKSSKTLSRKKENAKSRKTKQNLLLCNSMQNNFDTSKKLPVKPVVLSENSVTLGSSKVPVVIKPATSSSKIPVLVKPTTTNSKPPVQVNPTTTNSKPPLLVKATTNNSKPPVLVKPTTSNSKPPLLVKATTSCAVPPPAVITDKVECAKTVEVGDVDVGTTKDFAEETSTKAALAVSRINFKRGGANFGLDFTLGELEPNCSKNTDTSAAVSQAQTTVPASNITPATAAPSVAGAKQMQDVRDKAENNNYFTGPVRSFQFREKYPRNTNRHRVFVPAAPSTEHFTLENYFGFHEEPEDELTLSPVKRHSDPSLTTPPLTSTPHTATTKSVLPQPNRLIVKPKVKEYQHKANASVSASQNNCSQILARGGCGYKNSSSALRSTKTATFAVPQLRNVPLSATKNKQPFVTAGSGLAQTSITDYMQSNREVSCMSDVPFDTSLSNIEADELSITHTKPPRKSYERPVRKRRCVEHDDYVSDEEEEEPQTNTLSRKHSRSKRPKRSKKQDRMFEKWASNVSSQFEEIDSIALIVE